MRLLRSAFSKAVCGRVYCEIIVCMLLLFLFDVSSCICIPRAPCIAHASSNLPSMYQAAANNYASWPEGARTGLRFIGTTSFAALVLLLLM